MIRASEKAPPLFAGVLGPTRPAFEPRAISPCPVQPTSLDAWDMRDREGDRLLILRMIIDAGPITLDAIAERLKRSPNSISGRFTELKADGCIERLKERRKTRSGATAFLWIATAKGMERLKRGGE